MHSIQDHSLTLLVFFLTEYILYKLPTYSLASKPKIAAKRTRLLDAIILKLKKKEIIKALKIIPVVSAS